jgi:RimJ/RimL family protein N-acetyltransferase
MNVAPIILDGQHVRLEPLTPAHVEPLIAAAADGELWNTQVTIIPRPEGMSGYIQFALEGLAQGKQLPFVIVRKDWNAGVPLASIGYESSAAGNAGDSTTSDQIVGSTRFYEIRPEDRAAAIGYTWLAKSAQRTRVNTESKLLLLTHAFEDWHCNRVELITDVLNEQSRTAILRLGARQEGILRKHLILPNGRIRDSVIFSILNDEWPEVKQRLISRLEQKDVR